MIDKKIVGQDAGSCPTSDASKYTRDMFETLIAVVADIFAGRRPRYLQGDNGQDEELF